MDKAIVITLYNRPRQTKELLEHLERCEGVAEYKILINIDGDTGRSNVLAVHRLVIEFCERNPGVDVSCYHDHGSLGIDAVKLWLLAIAYEITDFVVFMEDDTWPSPMTLRWFETQYSLHKDSGGLCSITGYTPSKKEDVLPVVLPGLEKYEKFHWFTPWIWLIPRDVYDDAFGREGERYKEWFPEVNGRFDWYMREYIGRESSRYSIRPLVSYTRLLDAAEGATHTPSQAWFEQNEKTWVHL